MWVPSQPWRTGPAFKLQRVMEVYPGYVRFMDLERYLTAFPVVCSSMGLGLRCCGTFSSCTDGLVYIAGSRSGPSRAARCHQSVQNFYGQFFGAARGQRVCGFKIQSLFAEDVVLKP